MNCVEYLMVPFKHCGRDHSGVDCLGLVHIFYEREFGITLQDYQGYAEDWYKGSSDFFVQFYSEYGFEKTEAPTYGDVIFFTNGQGKVYHCGVLLDNGTFLHTNRQGTFVSTYAGTAWGTRIEGFYRYKGRK